MAAGERQGQQGGAEQASATQGWRRRRLRGEQGRGGGGGEQQRQAGGRLKERAADQEVCRTGKAPAPPLWAGTKPAVAETAGPGRSTQRHSRLDPITSFAMIPPAPPPAGPGRALRLQVRLFAGLREAMGWSERPLIAAAGATPLTIWRQLELAEAWRRANGAGAMGADPAVGEALPAAIRVAINQRFAPADANLVDGDEIAFLPPISGG